MVIFDCNAEWFCDKCLTKLRRDVNLLQARELARRISGLREVDVSNEWIMVIITIGTEEVSVYSNN